MCVCVWVCVFVCVCVCEWVSVFLGVCIPGLSVVSDMAGLAPGVLCRATCPDWQSNIETERQ